ncbi:MAG: methyltransferase domain-containing protein [Candidatus Magnetomorum sp.]|nr:methyltransferase domain-containing protein [Candidatus Magnetomorum sp.]
MNKKLLNYLVCPKSKTKLHLEDTIIDKKGRIQSGFLVSESGLKYPIINYIPRFILNDHYTDSFSIQRKYIEKRFSEWHVEKNRYRIFEESTRIPLDTCDKNSIFLDAGCGYGRFCELVSSYHHEIIGVDMSSTSIELAYQYIGDRDNVHLIQCDLTELPFQSAAFDYIFSIGVLHHTPAPYHSFSKLVPFLKSKGQISIWVYPPEMKKIDNLIRLITTRLPERLVFYMSMIMPFIYMFYKKIRRRSLPEDFRYWPCTLSFFDSWTPEYASVHLPEDVKQWFIDCSLQNITILKRRTALTAFQT